MKVYRYSRWDGRQEEFSLDARRALDAMSDLLMEGLDVEEALEWMRRYGFQLAGMNMRVMGVQELIDELRDRARSLYERYNLDSSTDELRERLDEILDREQRALRENAGFESSRMNDFMDRRHAQVASLSDAIERFRDYAFEDSEAGEAFRELLAELDRLRALEDFRRRQGRRFRGAESASYETAQQIREEIESLEQLARDLAGGNLESLTPDQLRDLLSDDAVESLILLRDLEGEMRRAGFLRDGGEGPELTPRAIRRIGAQALASVYGALRKGRSGGHETVHRGVAVPRPDETRPFEFGDSFDLHVVRTLLNGMRRRAAAGANWGRRSV